MPSTVDVPKEFRDIGYSGFFHLTIRLKLMSVEAVAELAEKVPMLSPTPGWMILSVDVDAGVAVIVCRDDVAVVDALTTRGRRFADG